MGLFTLAFPDQPQEPLQQSQYLVVLPVLVWASTVARPVARATTVRCLNDTIVMEMLDEGSQ